MNTSRRARWSARNEMVVAGLNGLNVICAFAAQMLVYRAFGASRETDVYFASAAIPQLVAMVLATTASGALVPLLARQRQDEQASLAWTLLLAGVLVVLLPALVLMFLAPHWVPRVFPGFTDGYQALCVELSRVQLAATPFIAASAVLTALHHARGQFAKVEALNLVLTAMVVLALYSALPRWGIVAAAWIFSIRFALQAALLGPALGRVKIYRSARELLQAWRAARVLLAGNAYFKTDVLVDRYLLSMGAAGSLSLVALVQSIYGALAGVIGQAWGSTAVPRLAVSFGARQAEQFTATYRRNFVRIVVISGVSFALLVVAAPPLMAGLTGQRFTPDDVRELSLLLLLLGGVPVFGSLGSLLAGTFYAVGDTRTPTAISIATFTVFIALKILVYSSFGLHAFCLLISAYYASNALILMAALKRRLQRSFHDDPSVRQDRVSSVS